MLKLMNYETWKPNIIRFKMDILTFLNWYYRVASLSTRFQTAKGIIIPEIFKSIQLAMILEKSITFLKSTKNNTERAILHK